jgi:hypothetical protein
LKRINRRIVKYLSHFAKNASLFERWTETDASIVTEYLANLPPELESKATLAIMTAMRKTYQMEKQSPLGKKQYYLFIYFLVEALRDFPDGKEKEGLLSIGGIALEDANSVFDVAQDLFELHITYIQKVYGFFYQFYVRSEGYNSYTAQQLDKLSVDADELRKVFEYMKDVNTHDFIFRYRPAMPLELILKELEEFKENVEFTAKMINTILCGSCFLSPFLGFVTDEIGRKETPKNLFSHWERYITVYDLHKKKNHPLAIAKVIQKQFGVWNTTSYPPTKLKNLVALDIKQAETLILSAAEGTFPH